MELLPGVHPDYLKGIDPWQVLPALPPPTPTVARERLFSLLFLGALFAAGVSLGGTYVAFTVAREGSDEMAQQRTAVARKFEDTEAQLRNVGTILKYLVAARRADYAAPVQTVQAVSYDEPPRLLSEPSAPRQVARVTAGKANLRIAPDLKGKPLMVVARGTELLVDEIHGQFALITAPTGDRAWIALSVIELLTEGRNGDVG